MFFVLFNEKKIECNWGEDYFFPIHEGDEVILFIKTERLESRQSLQTC